MQGLAEIKRANADIPQTKREVDYRAQRDKLAKALRRLYDEEIPFGRTPRVLGAVEEADKVLKEITGKGLL